jgi:hypothetical protein
MPLAQRDSADPGDVGQRQHDVLSSAEPLAGQPFWVCGRDSRRYLALPAVVASGTSASFPDFTSYI